MAEPNDGCLERFLRFQLRTYFAAWVRSAVNVHVEIAVLEALELIIREHCAVGYRPDGLGRLNESNDRWTIRSWGRQVNVGHGSLNADRRNGSRDRLVWFYEDSSGTGRGRSNRGHFLSPVSLTVRSAESADPKPPRATLPRELSS